MQSILINGFGNFRPDIRLEIAKQGEGWLKIDWNAPVAGSKELKFTVVATNKAVTGEESNTVMCVL
jgi:hypothetical protein